MSYTSAKGGTLCTVTNMSTQPLRYRPLHCTRCADTECHGHNVLHQDDHLLRGDAVLCFAGLDEPIG